MPPIPVGLATKLGGALAAILGAATVIQAFLDGDHSDTTIATLVGVIVTVYKIMDGRYNQAETALATGPDDYSGHPDGAVYDPAAAGDALPQFAVEASPAPDVGDKATP